LGAISYSEVRQITPENFFGQYYPATGTIGDPALLSEILNNDFIDNGTAVILIACKGICGEITGFRHGEHDGEFHELFASDKEIAGIKRVASVEYPGTLKQVITNDPDADASRKKRRGGKVNMHKFTIKKTKHKTRKTKSKTKKRRKRNNKNKNNNKKRTVSASSSAVK
jgi:hypothetical protein